MKCLTNLNLPSYAESHACVLNTLRRASTVFALTRIICPEANIPSTTALATINRDQGRKLGLVRGANVVMPNLTPFHYHPKYDIYPFKACIQETPEEFHLSLSAIGFNRWVERWGQVEATEFGATNRRR